MTFRLVAAISIASAILSTAASAAPAPDANSVLILSTTDGGNAYSNEATAQGFTAVVDSPVTWATRSAADFATFRAIVLGDPTCQTGTTAIAAAEANRSDWAAAVGAGPKLIIGTDEQFHFGQGGSQLISSGIEFVTSEPANTGLYVSLSCYYEGAPAGTSVTVLDPFGSFTVVDAPGCFDDSHIVASHPALVGTTDVSLSNWGCSVHEIFDGFPSATFVPLAIARNVGGAGSLSFADGSMGVPYILASGAGLVPIGTALPAPAMANGLMAILVAMLIVAGASSIARIRPKSLRAR